MAKRPWVTPDEVKAYTDYPKVKDRSDEKLKVDITRAEYYVINYTRNHFDDHIKYPTLPESVRTAVILVAEMYAFNAAEGGTGKGAYKSETFDDYSYTMADTGEKLDNLLLGPLLDEFTEPDSGSKVVMKLRKL